MLMPVAIFLDLGETPTPPQLRRGHWLVRFAEPCSVGSLLDQSKQILRIYAS
jgi:hypothetical protein